MVNRIEIISGQYSNSDSDTYYAFDRMVGDLQPKQEQLEVLIRPSRDGERLRSTGVRAAPSQLRTMHYVADRDTAIVAIEAYLALKDGLPRLVIQNGADYGYFRVLDIIARQLIPCTSVVGSIIANPTILQVVDWVLLSAPDIED